MLYINIITACRESMYEHIPISGVNNNGPNVIPGWDIECDLAREQSLLWHLIWKQSNKPVHGYVYDIMKSTRSRYHYKLKDLKRKKTM